MNDWVHRQPLAFSAAAALLGIGLAEVWPGTVGRWLGLGLIVLAAAVAPAFRWWPRALWVGLGLLCVFGGLHSRRLADTFGHPLLEKLEGADAPAAGVPAEVHARVLRTFQEPGKAVRCEVLATSIQFTGSSAAMTTPCRLSVFLPEGHPPIATDECRLSGLLRAIQRGGNEGQFEARDFALRQGWVADLSVLWLVPVEGPWWKAGPRLLRDAADRCRRSIQERLSLGLADQPQALSVIQAMVLGASEDTDPRIEDAFRRSGTLHVFAVSGLHVGLLSVIAWNLLRPLGLRRHRLVLILIPLVFAYAYITGWRPSAARAALMISVLLGGTLIQRQVSLINSLGGAALLLLAFDTHLLFQVGFQLSFGVLLAIALLAGPLLERFKPWTQLDPFLPPALASNRQRLGLWLRRQFAGLMGVSGAAWLGSLPLMWYHFQTITPAALIANCLLIPLSFVCLGLACLSLCVSLLSLGWLQALLNQACAVSANLMVVSAGWFAAIPGANFYVPPLSLTPDPAAAELRWFALPYGSEAGLLRVDDHHWMLDGGSMESYARVILPGLKQAGVNRLEGLFLSHADAAHVGAAGELLRTMPTSRLYHPRHEPWRFDSRMSSMRQVLEQKLEGGGKGPRVQGLSAGEVVAFDADLRPARLTVLYPGPRDTHSTADDRGLVARLELGRLRLLWMADAGFITESALVSRREDLKCDVLVRGAHESDVHGSSVFLEAASPKVIVSLGSESLPGLNLPKSVQTYARIQKIPLLVLPECGEVRIRLPAALADHFTIETFGSGERHRLPIGTGQ